MKDVKKYLAEFIGTFVLVLVACGVAGQTGGSLGVTSVAFGLVIVAMAYSIGNVSGCHINPAVSIAMLCAKKMSLKDFIGYVVAQFLGAIAGAAVLMAIVGDAGKLGCNALYNDNAGISFVIEAILTCIFVLTILGVTSKQENSSIAGLVIGRADPGSPAGHQLHRHLRESRPQLRPGPDRRQPERHLGVPAGSAGGRHPGGCDLRLPEREGIKNPETLRDRPRALRPRFFYAGRGSKTRDKQPGRRGSGGPGREHGTNKRRT